MADDTAPPAEAPVTEAPAPEAPVSAAPAAEAAPEAPPAPENPPSLLSSAEGKPPDTPAPAADAAPEADTTEAAKPAAAEPAEAAAKDETDPAKTDATPERPKDEAPAPLSIDDFNLPEGANRDSEDAKTFLDIVNNRELGHKDRVQQLLDLHKRDIERVYRETAEHQQQVWRDLNKGWQDQLRSDREIGGNQMMTNLSKAKGFIDHFLSEAEAKALLQHTDLNGMGNFPPFIRLLARAATALNLFEDGMVVSNPVPPRPARGPGNRGWYDQSLNRNSGA